MLHLSPIEHDAPRAHKAHLMTRQHTALIVATLLSTLTTLGCVGSINESTGDPTTSQDKPDSDGMPLPDESADMNTMRPDDGPDDGPVVEDPKEPKNPNLLPQNELFTCADPAKPVASPARLRRMLSIEWTRAVGERAGSEASNNPLQSNDSNLYSTYDRNVSLDTATLEQYLGMNEYGVVPHLRGGHPGSDSLQRSQP